MAKLKIQKTYTGGAGYQAGASIVVDSYANNQKLAANGVASSRDRKSTRLNSSH